MAYSTIDKPTDYFNTVLYTGNGGSQNITGVGFSPDWVWLKGRNNANNHNLNDTVRGVNKQLYADINNAETTATTHLTALDSDGFTVGSETDVNGSSRNFVAWNWLAGGSASSNSDGSITSSVSANTTAGFSIVTYTGTGSAATVGHGLGAVPKMFWTKRRDNNESWGVYHHTQGAGKFLRLESTNAVDTSSTLWNNTTPTSSVFSIAVGGIANTSSGTYVAYWFAEKKGYSKFGSYTGNASTDGTFVYTGFKPAFLIVKNTATSPTDWIMIDNKRPGYNENLPMQPNKTDAEGSSATADLLSNGFKVRNQYGGFNGSGAITIYMAFAESPFVNSNGIPTNAR